MEIYKVSGDEYFNIMKPAEARHEYKNWGEEFTGKSDTATYNPFARIEAVGGLKNYEKMYGKAEKYVRQYCKEHGLE